MNQNNDSWSLPKGHQEDGEESLQTAIREIEEETGIPKDALNLICKLGVYERPRIVRYPTDPIEIRLITMYLFLTNHNNTLSPSDPENPEAKWVRIEDVSSLLTHPKDKEFFREIIHVIKNIELEHSESVPN